MKTHARYPFFVAASLSLYLIFGCGGSSSDSGGSGNGSGSGSGGIEDSGEKIEVSSVKLGNGLSVSTDGTIAEPNSSFVITFPEKMFAGSMTEDNISFYDSNETRLSTQVSEIGSDTDGIEGNEFVATPSTAFTNLSGYALIISGGTDGVASESGKRLSDDVLYVFRACEFDDDFSNLATISGDISTSACWLQNSLFQYASIADGQLTVALDGVSPSSNVAMKKTDIGDHDYYLKIDSIDMVLDMNFDRIGFALELEGDDSASLYIREWNIDTMTIMARIASLDNEEQQDIDESDFPVTLKIGRHGTTVALSYLRNTDSEYQELLSFDDFPEGSAYVGIMGQTGSASVPFTTVFDSFLRD